MKKRKISIGLIIAAGFGLLILFIIVVNYKTVVTLSKSSAINSKIVTIHSPSVDKLQELKIMTISSLLYVSKWVGQQGDLRFYEKQALIRLTEKEYPELRKEINQLSKNWSKQEIDQLTQIFAEMDVLLSKHEIIRTSLASFDDYEDEINVWAAQAMIEDGGEISDQTMRVVKLLDTLILEQRKNTDTDTHQILSSYQDLNFYVKQLGIFIIIAGVLISIGIIWSIVTPVKQVKNQLLLLGKGIIPNHKIKPRNDEIGEMASALNDLLDGFKRTKEFAQEVGAGNFQVSYQPLSEQDVLGHSLLRMKTDLFELTSDLEHKVIERTAKIEEQKLEIETLLTHTTDSIRYAKRIQEAILPSKKYIETLLPNSFFLFLPKDIVSGDFYWLHQHYNKVYVGAVDCTGHGVPGAFMTIIGYNALMKVVQNSTEDLNPGRVLDEVNKTVMATFDQQGGESIRDGMDAVICAIDYENNTLEYAGAYNPMFYIRNEELIEVNGDKFPVGSHVDKNQTFTNKTIPFQRGDMFYIFSDGYADQFGGPKGKKFRYNNFRETLMSIHRKTLDEQRGILLKTFHDWRGDLEQVDDILIIGLKF